jgi:carbon storage regulator
MMHIYGLRLGEKVWLGDEDTATIVAIKGGIARLGIDAPRDVPIHREEIAESGCTRGWARADTHHGLDVSDAESEFGAPAPHVQIRWYSRY